MKYEKGKYPAQEVRKGIVSFMREKGGEVHNDEIAEFCQRTYELDFTSIRGVMVEVRKNHPEVVKGEKRGYSKLIETVEA